MYTIAVDSDSYNTVAIVIMSDFMDTLTRSVDVTDVDPDTINDVIGRTISEMLSTDTI